MAEELDRAKVAAARAAVAAVRDGQAIALGTGSTAAFAIREIAARFPRGGRLRLVASSVASERLARELGLPVRELDAGERFDLMVDGADEVTDALDLTKGGGGALFREKLLARLAKRLAIIVDPTKRVETLGGRSPIPVEIVPFARDYVLEELRRLSLAPVRRTNPIDGTPYLTDNRLEIVDVTPTTPIVDPAGLDARLHAIQGVVETGLFLGMADVVYVGHPDGRVDELHRPAERAPPRR